MIQTRKNQENDEGRFNLKELDEKSREEKKGEREMWKSDKWASTAMTAGGHLVIGSTDGTLHVMDVHTGTRYFSYTQPWPISCIKTFGSSNSPLIITGHKTSNRSQPCAKIWGMTSYGLVKRAEVAGAKYQIRDMSIQSFPQKGTSKQSYLLALAFAREHMLKVCLVLKLNCDLNSVKREDEKIS